MVLQTPEEITTGPGPAQRPGLAEPRQVAGLSVGGEELSRDLWPGWAIARSQPLARGPHARWQEALP